MNGFRVVLLERPWDFWQDKSIRQLFTSVVALKKTGYGAEYPDWVLPVDGSDYYASHIMVCREAGSTLSPVMAYRSVPLDEANSHRSSFGGLSLARSVASHEHELAVAREVERCALSGRRISYDSSWTIDPELRKDEASTRYLRDLMKAIHVLHHLDSGVQEIIAGGATRFKMEKLYQFWGYRELSLDGRVLPPLNLPTYNNEEVIVFHLRQFAELALAHAKKFESEWKARLIFGEALADERLRRAG